MKIRCTECKRERSISKAGFAKKKTRDKGYPKNYVCRFCRGAARKVRTRELKKKSA